MGQEILYCNRCGTKLHGDDFTRGRAHTIDHKQFCQKCVSINLVTGEKKVAAEVPAEPRPSQRKVLTAPPRSSRATSLPSRSRTTLYIGLGVALVAAGIGVTILMSPSPPPPAPPILTKPDAAQIKGQKEKMAQELKELEAKVAPLLQGEQFAAVAALLEEARKHYDAPEWTGPVARLIKEVQELPAGLYGAAREKAVAARVRGAIAESEQVRARVASWGQKGLLDDLDRTLSGVVPREPLPAGAKVLMRFPDDGSSLYRTAGELKEGALYGRRDPDCSMAGFERGGEILKIPSEAEIRVTYRTTNSAPIQVVLQGPDSTAKVHQFHFLIEKPELGRPASAKMATARLVDWNNVLIEKGFVVDNIYVRQEGAKADVVVYEFVVFATKE